MCHQPPAAVEMATWSAPVEILNHRPLIYSIKVWDISDLTLLQNVKTGHSEDIPSLSISEDGKLLASGSRDKTIKLWPINIIEKEHKISQSS